jgi:hypothetical protein
MSHGAERLGSAPPMQALFEVASCAKAILPLGRTETFRRLEN